MRVLGWSFFWEIYRERERKGRCLAVKREREKEKDDEGKRGRSFNRTINEKTNV